MKHRCLTILIVVFFSHVCIYAQSKLSFNLDYHYNLGLVEHTANGNITRSDCKMYGNSLHLSALYRITDIVAVGAGIGLDRYEYDDNTLPIFATIHVSPFKKMPKVYAYSNIGYALNGSNITSGILWDLGVGYKLMLKRQFGLNFQLGYDFKKFNDSSLRYYEDNVFELKDNTLHSLSFGIGLIF